MSASRQLRALTTSYRALSARNVAQRCASPARPGFVSPQQSARFIVASPVSPLQSRTFSASALTREEGASDATLSQRLQEEIKYEKEAMVEEDMPEFLKAFQAEQIWNVEETPGSDEITLQRTFGNEQIRVMFSIADIDTSSEQQALDPEDEEGGDSEAEDEETSPSYPIRTSITISKPNGGRGALSIDALCQDGVFSLDNIAYYPDAQLATELTADADWKRRGLYIGPQFDHLDVNVQEEFEKFLRERGIAEGLALFIPEFAEHKEQKEYVKWLESVKEFIDV
ncbi:mitochondrial glycoprotein [Gautieria morchelliformis]|nr:mitochondrial glycoprotein [Gautieria morchelliformis]